MSHTTSFSETFSIVNARALAANMMTDLELCSQKYGKPSESLIEDYKNELVTLMKDQYVDTYEFGFEDKQGNRVVSWKYKIEMYSADKDSDSPGNVFRKANIEGCSYFNFLTYTDKWWALNENERIKIKDSLPIQRATGKERSDGNGYWKEEKVYKSGSGFVTRRTFIPVYS